MLTIHKRKKTKMTAKGGKGHGGKWKERVMLVELTVEHLDDKQPSLSCNCCRFITQVAGSGFLNTLALQTLGIGVPPAVRQKQQECEAKPRQQTHSCMGKPSAGALVLFATESKHLTVCFHTGSAVKQTKNEFCFACFTKSSNFCADLVYLIISIST